MSDPTKTDPLPDNPIPAAQAGEVPPPTIETKRHPFRAFLASILLAIGLVLVLLVTKVIELALTPVILVIVIVLVLGTLWGLFGPPSSPGDPPPPPPIPVADRPVLDDHDQVADPRDWKPPASD